MIKTNFNEVKQHDVMGIGDFGQMLKNNGFKFMKRYSTDEHRIFVSEDGRFVIHVLRNEAKIYSTKDQKTCLHVIGLKK